MGGKSGGRSNPNRMALCHQESRRVLLERLMEGAIEGIREEKVLEGVAVEKIIDDWSQETTEGVPPERGASKFERGKAYGMELLRKHG